MSIDREIDFSKVAHQHERPVDCSVCGRTIRRRTPCLRVGAGHAHRACALNHGAKGSPELAPIAPKVRRVKTGSTGNRARNTLYGRKRAELLEQCRRLEAWQCAWCGRSVSPNLPKAHPLKWTADHFVAVANDPTHESLVPSCQECNRNRSDKPGPPPWLAGWVPGHPLPETPSARVARERIERSARRATARRQDRRPWLRDRERNEWSNDEDRR